jgi:ribosomal protein S18 acetylase RimI-like enzyme
METEVSQIHNISDLNLRPPDGFSFYQPYLRYSVKEALDVGGEAYVANNPDGITLGLFIYDASERLGTIYTKSREVFDYFFKLKPFSFLWSEFATENQSEIFDIYTLDLEDRPIVHSFKHQITLADDQQVDDVERFIISAQPEINKKWVRVAFANGEKCFTIRLDKEVAGLAWLSNVNGIGKLHSLNVKPQFRKMGMGRDLLFARLLWLKAKHARTAFSEISRQNLPSVKVAMKGNMTATRQVFQYYGKDPERRAEPKSLTSMD